MNEQSVRIHDLKIWPQFFDLVMIGIKTYEVRVNDRAFQIGDELRLKEWDPITKNYTGRELLVRIKHMTDSSTWYMIPNHLAILGIEIVQ